MNLYAIIRVSLPLALAAAALGCTQEGSRGEQGPRGEQGEPGQDGERGPRGWPGLPGASYAPPDRYTAIDTWQIEPGGSSQLLATCDPGDRLVTGGCELFNGGGSLVGSTPVVGVTDADAWHCTATASDTGATLRAIAVCEESE